METTNLIKGIANANTIESRLFEVTKVQLHPNIEGFNSPDNYGVYKTTGGAPLGVVGSVYEPTQPKILFNSLIETISETEFGFDEMKFNELKGGKIINFEIPVGMTSYTNLLGKEDESVVKLHLQTGYDGYTKTTMFLSTYRLVCSNGMKRSHTEFALSYKNTKGNIGKSYDLSMSIQKLLEEKTTLQEMEQLLMNKQVNQAKVDEFLKRTVGYSQKEYNELTAQKRKTLDEINKNIELEFSRTGSSLFGLLQGITCYTNHSASTKDRDSFLFLDSGKTLNDKAWNNLLEMATN